MADVLSFCKRDVRKYSEPRFDEPLHNKVLGITNDIIQPSNSVMYGKEPQGTLDLTSQFPQSLGNSLNGGSLLLKSMLGRGIFSNCAMES